LVSIAQLTYGLHLMHIPFEAIGSAVVYQLVGAESLAPYHLLLMTLVALLLASIPAGITFIYLERPIMLMRDILERKIMNEKFYN